MPSTEFAKNEVIRGCSPPFSVWLMNSKLNAWIMASRTRQSLNTSRRVFITIPVMPVGRLCGTRDFTMSPDWTAGKSYCAAHLAALVSRIVDNSPALKASNIAVASPKNSIRISSMLLVPRRKFRSLPQ